MSIELQNLFPEEISDEMAFNLVELFSNITAMMESHYFAQIRRHFESIRPCYPRAYPTGRK